MSTQGLRRLEIAAAVLAVALPLTVYLTTLFPGVGGRIGPGDSAKFQFVPSVLGVAHQPGYPLYTLLGRAWLQLPLPGSLANQMNAFSAIWAGGANLLLLLMVRALTGRLWIAALTTLLFGLSGTHWLMATDAEIHSLTLFLFAGTLFAGVRWHQSRSARWLVALCIGAALAGC